MKTLSAALPSLGNIILLLEASPGSPFPPPIDTLEPVEGDFKECRVRRGTKYLHSQSLPLNQVVIGETEPENSYWLLDWFDGRIIEKPGHSTLYTYWLVLRRPGDVGKYWYAWMASVPLSSSSGG